MNILFFTENFPPEVNAAASRVYERACYWVKMGHQVTVITCAPNFPQGKLYPGYKNKWFQEEVISGIRVVRVKTFIAKNDGILLRTIDFVSYLITSLFASIKIKQIDIVSATSPQFFAGISGWLAALIKRKPFVLELGDLWPASIAAVGVMQDNFLIRFFEKIELFLYRKATAIVTLTHSIKQDLVRRNIPSDKISVVLNGVDLSRFSPRPYDPELAKQYGLENKFVIGYIGTHGMAHDLHKVLHLAEKMQRETDLLFLFVGDGAAKPQLLESAKQTHLTNVKFLPPVSKDEIAKLWGLCNVALVHLRNTPLFAGVIPSKIFEAMGMGLPILLVAPSGEAADIINNTESGINVLPDQPEQFEEAILRFKNNPIFCHATAMKSHQAADRYTRERQALDFLQVLDKVNTAKLTECAEKQ